MTLMSPPCLRNSAMSAGTSVMCPAACELTPTTSTLDCIAAAAVSAGVENRLPTSTSKPRSAKPDAITLAPLSCPSCPIFATYMRGLRPCCCSKSSTCCCTLSNSWAASSDTPLNVSSYAPLTTLVTATCRPHVFSRALLISPRVALALAASTASNSRLGASPGGLAEACDNLSRQSNTVLSSRLSLTRRIDSICARSTAVLSILNTSMGFCSVMYLFTPTTTSLPASMRACFLVAASSIRNFAMPLSMAFVMPPSPSTSSIISIACLSSSSVRLSII
mmetsp:Transcript_13725/g.30267  ORF Transcript_13725/g.30267 Transcript_13725/m.30267 type:complete len:278 (-) Transcript_13725:1382-2215(-)